MMAKTKAQRVLDQVIEKALVPIMKSDGFTRSGHTHRRTVGECIHVVSVQPSQWSSPGEVAFTLALGVFFPDVHAAGKKLYGWEPGPAGPRESECQVRARIGELMPAKQDHWWVLTSGDGPEPIATQVEDVYRRRGRPWLSKLSNFAAARRSRFTENVAKVAFSLAARDRQTAHAQLTKLLDDTPDASVIRDWAVALGFRDLRLP